MAGWFHRLRARLRRHSDQARRCRPRIEGLEDRCLLAAPVIDAISNVSGNIPVGKTLVVPVTATDPDGDAITYSITSNNANIQPQLKTGNTFLRVSVQGFGEMVFELFNDSTPQTVQQITNLVNSNFYNNLTFHRIVRDFVIQGGDPRGDGTGGPGFQFNDEFVSDLIFSGNGQLAMANSGKDTNGSQFFVTVGPQRALDFNHTIYGQLVRGFNVLQAINQVQTNSSTGAPLTPVTITKAEIIQDTTDGVFTLRAAPGTPASAVITVTATDSHGESSSRTFNVQSIADNVNDPVILGPIGNQTTPRNTPVSFTLTGSDLENDAIQFTAQITDSPAHGTVTVNGSRVTVTPEANFTGLINLQVAAAQVGATSRGSTSNPFDTQKISVNVTNTDAPLTAQGANISTQTGVPFTNVTVATFTDADPTSQAGQFAAVIAWGDNTTSAGTVQAGQNGGFVVVGSHTYATAGNFSVQTTITGTPPADGVTASTAQATGAAVVADAGTNPPPDNGGGNNGGSNGGNGGGTPTPVVLTVSQRFVQNAYQDILGRDAEAGALQTFSTMIDQGRLTHQQLLLGLQLSPEGRFLAVHRIYQQLLGRLADPSGLQASLSFLGHGGTVEQLRSIITASSEYFQSRAGGTNAGFISAMYQDALGRAPDSVGNANISAALTNGADRLTIARDMYLSAEFKEANVKNAFQQLFKRAPNSNELTAFRQYYHTTHSNELLLATLAGTAEYLAKPENQ